MQLRQLKLYEPNRYLSLLGRSATHNASVNMSEDYYSTIDGVGPKVFSVSPDLVDYAPVDLPPDFDHLTQRMFFALNNGTLRSFDFNQLDDEMRFGTQWSLVYGIVIGMSIMTLLHVVALTPAAKRRTMIYWLNIVGLCLVFTRGIFQAMFFRDRWTTYYVMFSGDAATVPVLHRLHLTASTWLAVFNLTMVEILFFTQGRAIMNSVPRRYYYAVMGAMLLVATVTITMKIIMASYGMKDVWIWRYVTVNGSNMPIWLDPASKSVLLLVCPSLTSRSHHLCHQYWSMVFDLVLLHRPTDLDPLEDEHDPWTKCCSHECPLSCWRPVYDHTQ